MIVLMFKPQFAPLVLSGEKCQTIRPPRKRQIRIGERVSLRKWAGKPYRSKQPVLRESVITEVTPISITEDLVSLGSNELALEQTWSLAKADGFNTLKDFFEWFRFTHGLPFYGVLIKWKDEMKATNVHS